MKRFKFLSNNEEVTLSTYSPIPVNPEFYTTLTVAPTNGLTRINTTNTINDYCFQINYGTPIVFASSVDPLTITLSGDHSDISFTDDINIFRLFSRSNENI